TRASSAAGARGGAARVALLLPAADGAFRTATAAVLAGVRAAHARDGQGVGIEVFVEPADENEMIALYREFVARSTGLVIGPLTRDAVNMLGAIDALPMPTVTLNFPESGARVPGNVLLFGLSVENEAAQMARFAFQEARDRAPMRYPLAALAVSNSTPLARRGAQAFVATWRSLGGLVLEPVTADTRALGELRTLLHGKRADAYFVGLHPDVVIMMRSVVGLDAPLYGTSTLNTGMSQASGALPEGDLERRLDGVRLVEMPWQVQPAHPAVMAYQRAHETFPHLELQRLYALGIDAFRIARERLAGQDEFELDGLTGRLSVRARIDNRVGRSMVVCQYLDGVVVPLETE
ncbi:MAG: penicillin-binding protein activator, partial [Burkholderiaceae bacterium]|nr:penicillin-binding protein activator [Burkholderiaceae bacterium]